MRNGVVSKPSNLFRYILLLALALRCIHIFSPTIGDNSWRQSDTAAMARNFYENGFNFFYPQIDWGGTSEGYVETEFPLYPFLVALLYKVFDVHEFIGRLLSVVCSLITIWVSFRLVKKIFDEPTALWASFFLSILPFVVYYSRNFFPEPMMVMMIVLGVYFFLRWIESDHWLDFLLSAFFTALACLLKIPSLYIGLPLFFLSYQKYQWRSFRNVNLYVYTLIVFVPVALWYSHAHNIFLQSGLSFGIWEYGSDKWGNWNLLTTWNFWNSIIFRNLAEKHFTWFGFPVLIIGFFLHRNSRLEYLFDYWIAALMIYVLIVAKGNFVHAYYQLPFLVPCSVFMAKVYAKYFIVEGQKRKVNLLLSFTLAGIIIFSAWRIGSLMERENINASPEFELASMMKQKTPAGSRIVVIDRNDPTIFYLAHRKGWHASPSDMTMEFLASHAIDGQWYLAGVFDYLDVDQKKEIMILIESSNVVWKNERSFIITMPQSIVQKKS